MDYEVKLTDADKPVKRYQKCTIFYNPKNNMAKVAGPDGNLLTHGMVWPKKFAIFAMKKKIDKLRKKTCNKF